jgi:endogenous inhibitor of DNA gyrase (YacG/DUF329 family)
MNIIAPCPICQKDSVLEESNPYRPFCSKRCRMIDLGQWINESYSISDTTLAENIVTPDSEKTH